MEYYYGVTIYILKIYSRHKTHTKMTTTLAKFDKYIIASRTSLINPAGLNSFSLNAPTFIPNTRYFFLESTLTTTNPLYAISNDVICGNLLDNNRNGLYWVTKPYNRTVFMNVSVTTQATPSRTGSTFGVNLQVGEPAVQGSTTTIWLDTYDPIISNIVWPATTSTQTFQISRVVPKLAPKVIYYFLINETPTTGVSIKVDFKITA